MTNTEDVESQLEILKGRVAALTAAHSGCDARIRELREKNAVLEQQTLASRLLVRSVDRENVLTAIEEIVVTMIGAEEVAIFDIDYVERSYRVARARGIDPASPRLARAMDRFEDVVSSGRPLIAGHAGAARGSRAAGDKLHARDGGGELTAALPLTLDGCVTGIVGIFRLGERKDGFGPVDHALFEVLGQHAAMALHGVKFDSLRPTVRPPRA
jgi:GAF domain-containing protein